MRTAKKALVAACVAGIASSGAWLVPAFGNDCPAQDTDPTDGSISIQTPVGGVCGAGDPATQQGHLFLDGESTNPGPAAGYISASNDGQGGAGICADDNGGPVAGGSSPTCVTVP